MSWAADTYGERCWPYTVTVCGEKYIIVGNPLPVEVETSGMHVVEFRAVKVGDPVRPDGTAREYILRGQVPFGEFTAIVQ